MEFKAWKAFFRTIVIGARDYCHRENKLNSTYKTDR